jgi:two-component system, NtrC family, sensor kinase
VRFGRFLAGEPGADHRVVRFSTRWKLLLAFAAPLVAFVLALLAQLSGLHRMEATLQEMRDHEDEMRLALDLEDAVRDQYAHEARLVRGERLEPEVYARARQRTRSLIAVLQGRVDEPETIGRIDDIAEASAALERVFDEQVRPAALTGTATATAAHEQAYPFVSRIEGNVDLLFGLLQNVTSSSRRELMVLERSAVHWIAGLLLLTPLLVAGAALYLTRAVATPLARLGRGAAALASGNLDARVDINTPDEFGALAADLNAMTLSLRSHQARLVESEKLAGIGRLAGGIAHELNNPLQVMIGYLSLNRDIADRRLAEQLAAVEDEAHRCKEVVDGLLDLSRPATSAPAAVELRDLCEDAWRRLLPTADGPTLSLDGSARALADSSRVRQVVFNLLKNAAEAAGPTGKVRVHIVNDQRTAELSIHDTGPGFPESTRSRLFEPFFTTKPGGTGLGLAVSRAIARANGGDIEAARGSDGGAVFKLRLPAVEGST